MQRLTQMLQTTSFSFLQLSEFLAKVAHHVILTCDRADADTDALEVARLIARGGKLNLVSRSIPNPTARSAALFLLDNSVKIFDEGEGSLTDILQPLEEWGLTVEHLSAWIAEGRKGRVEA